MACSSCDQHAHHSGSSVAESFPCGHTLNGSARQTSCTCCSCPPPQSCKAQLPSSSLTPLCTWLLLVRWTCLCPQVRAGGRYRGGRPALSAPRGPAGAGGARRAAVRARARACGRAGPPGRAGVRCQPRAGGGRADTLRAGARGARLPPGTRSVADTQCQGVMDFN